MARRQSTQRDRRPVRWSPKLGLRRTKVNYRGSNSSCVSCRASRPMPDGLLSLPHGGRCLVRLIHIIGPLILLLGSPTPAVAQPATPVTATPVADGNNFSGLVDIGGGRRLYLQ